MDQQSPAQGGPGTPAARQYSLVQILAVWAAAAVPMGVLAWVIAPWLADLFGGDEPLGKALLIVLTVGLIWQFVLVLILTWRELGTLRWSRVREALWLRAPRDPKTGRRGGSVWWWALLFVALFGVWQLVPGIPGPSPRDLGEFLSSDSGEAFSGAWGWFALVIVLAVFTTVLGEELLFRGLLLPRMGGGLRQVGLGSQWSTVRALSPAPTVDDPLVDRQWTDLRLSIAAVQERVDGDHRPFRPECAGDRPRAPGRAGLGAR